MSSFNISKWQTENYPHLWDLNGLYLHNRKDKKMDLNVQKTYLKRFEQSNKIELIKKIIK